MANSSITGKAAIVTGGASGIGLALVKYFASQNYQIAILDISVPLPNLLPSLQTEFPKTAFKFHRCDISNWNEQKSVFEEVYKDFGSVDVVCANAGVSEIGKFLEMEEEGEGPRKPVLKTLDINLVGTLYSIKLAVYYMRKNTSSHKGQIICTASNAGLYPFPIAPMYGITKHGVVGAVRALAKPLEPEGIRINGICPNCIGKSLHFSIASRRKTVSDKPI
ncbi:hypothetical protein ONS95_001954 [Cadophora gregata]|uniref:uncharacterized protein n=1 Tax=Cadophora gregata TaxID=51156 RepID=UPI0026DB8A3C|nr:uncharacterized protein ONS95_001954 [Cadophora gregata]KAK0111608.1 hypothetical protein ONS95_001954 [Cadophora gregata]KAK0111916.1 hypothetical protein ONS96_001183 [Cadophora gregata f. sp. sojae]